MSLAERLRILEAAEDDLAMLALATVDLAHGSLGEPERARIKEAVFAAAVPHWCDRDLLAALLETSAEEGATLVAQLRKLRIVEPFPARGEEAINVHEATRLTLREHLRTSQPAQWRKLSQRALDWVSRSTAPHARIEALYHRFAVDHAAATEECALLVQQVMALGRPEVQDALALALKELDKAGWLTGPALVEAQFPLLEIRSDRGEKTQIESAARELLRLSTEAEYTSGIARAKALLGSALQAQGHLTTAMEAFREHQRISLQNAEQDPDNIFWRIELAHSFASVGDIQASQGNCRDAAVAFDELLRIITSLCEQDSSNPGYKRGLVGAQARLADLHQAGAG